MFDHVDPHHDVAQICRRGHLVNTGIHETPEYSKEFCPKCGQKTLTACEHCKAPINGQWHGLEGFMAMDEDDVPVYCHACGRPYPWTAEGIDAASSPWCKSVNGVVRVRSGSCGDAVANRQDR
jgi:hypothetical protein